MLLSKHRFGYSYGCQNYPECRMKNSADQLTGKPRGSPTDPLTRYWRAQAHEKFDHIWRGGTLSREAAYKLMRQIMSMSEDDCHISNFTKAQCDLLIKRLEELGYGDIDLHLEAAQ